METTIHQKHYEQIRKIAETSPIVQTCLHLYHCGEVTWEEMLIMAVGHLAVDNMALQKNITRHIGEVRATDNSTPQKSVKIFCLRKGKEKHGLHKDNRNSQRVTRGIASKENE